MSKIMEDAYNEEFAIGFIEGHNEGRIEGFAEMVQIQMKNKGFTITDAMNELGIPDDLRSAVTDYLCTLENAE